MTVCFTFLLLTEPKKWKQVWNGRVRWVYTLNIRSVGDLIHSACTSVLFSTVQYTAAVFSVSCVICFVLFFVISYGNLYLLTHIPSYNEQTLRTFIHQNTRFRIQHEIEAEIGYRIIEVPRTYLAL